MLVLSFVFHTGFEGTCSNHTLSTNAVCGFFFCFLQCYLLSYPHESQTKAFYCLNIVTGLSRLRSLHYNHIICASMQLPVIRFDIHFSHFVVTLAIQQDFTETKCNVSPKSCYFIRFVSNCNCYLLISATQCLPRLCPRSLLSKDWRLFVLSSRLNRNNYPYLVCYFNKEKIKR